MRENVDQNNSEYEHFLGSSVQIYHGLAGIQSSTCTTYKEYQRWPCKLQNRVLNIYLINFV